MPKYSAQFKFNTEDAISYGVPEAVVLFNIRYWVKINEEKQINYFEGKYWTFNSCTQYTKVFPFYSDRQISRLLVSLEKKGAIISGNFNKRGYDKTKWTTLALPETADPSTEIGRPIPDVKPYIKQDHEINNDNRCSLMYEDTEENNINFVDKMR